MRAVKVSQHEMAMLASCSLVGSRQTAPSDMPRQLPCSPSKPSISSSIMPDGVLTPSARPMMPEAARMNS